MTATRRRLRSACVLSVAACTGGRDVPDGYGATTERNFTEGCVTSLTADGDGRGQAYGADAADDVCGCAYEEITSSDGISYERFRALDDAEEEQPSALPVELREAIDRCQPASEDTSPGE